ncbi:MAG: hypothetical protein ACLQVI_37480, partial [Polyangiaceae bacterium]
MHRRPVPLLCPLLLAVPLSCSPAPSPPPAVAVTPPTPSSSATASPPAPSPLRFSVSFPSSLSATSIDGRLLVVLAKSDAEEPRKQISDRDGTAQVFG